MQAIEIVKKCTILEKQYNKLLIRFNKATAFLENSSTTEKEVEQWLPEYQTILMQMNQLCNNIEKVSGFRPTINEFLGGFIK